jgi:hypothetical protein
MNMAVMVGEFVAVGIRCNVIILIVLENSSVYISDVIVI